ncbi:MAG: hypothetical protein EOO40_13070, partial [Deltaproteobacteria bacterium]
MTSINNTLKTIQTKFTTKMTSARESVASACRSAVSKLSVTSNKGKDANASKGSRAPTAPAVAAPKRTKLEQVKRAFPFAVATTTTLGALAIAGWLTSPLWLGTAVAGAATAGAFLTTNPIGWAVLGGAALLAIAVG